MTEYSELEIALDAGYRDGQADAAAEISRLQAELSEAREIMKPFAKLADYCDQPKHSGCENLFIVPVKNVAKDSIIKVEHCRSARAFLKGETDDAS